MVWATEALFRVKKLAWITVIVRKVFLPTHLMEKTMGRTISNPICLMLFVVSLVFGACSHPVDESWIDKNSTDFHGTSTLNCAECHDLSVDCSSCHFGALGDKSPSEWVHGTDSHEQLESSGPVCNTCHALSRSYGNGPGACHDCHED